MKKSELKTIIRECIEELDEGGPGRARKRERRKDLTRDPSRVRDKKIDRRIFASSTTSGPSTREIHKHNRRINKHMVQLSGQHSYDTDWRAAARRETERERKKYIIPDTIKQAKEIPVKLPKDKK